MRIPPTPPTLPVDHYRLSQIFVHALHHHGALLRRANDEYWSWDRLRRHPMPKDLDAESAWHCVSLLRLSQSRALGLRDKAEKPFRYMLTDPMLDELLQIEAGHADPLGTLRGVPHGTDREFQLHAMIAEAADSSVLEGAARTRKQAREFLRSGAVPRDKHEQMIVNNFKTIEMLEELSSDPLTPGLIDAIHRAMTEGTLDDPGDAGRIQLPGEDRVRVEDGEGILLHSPPSADRLPDRLRQMCEFADAKEPYIPVVLRAMLLHFQLAYDHPYVDGNGRTARALFYWAMLRERRPLVRYLSISSVVLESRAQYQRAYLDVEQTGDVTYFLVYHLHVYQKALANLKDTIMRRRNDEAAAEETLGRHTRLNLRQKLFLRASLRSGLPSVVARAYASEFSVNFMTAMSDLEGLAEQGFLVLTRTGRRKHFAVPRDLRLRLHPPPDSEEDTEMAEQASLPFGTPRL